MNRISALYHTFIISLILLLVPDTPIFCQLVATGDTTICRGGHAQLGATGGGASYMWYSYPTDPTLLIPQQQFPVVSPQVTTMYVVQSNIATGNLILNGTFELGVTGFSSDYVNNQVSIVDEGTYAVVHDAHTVHPNFYCNQDHTTGSGLFMAVNGAGVPNVKVWYLTLNNIQPEARYEFSTWITSLHPTNPAILQFSINGQLLGDPFQAYPTTCNWYQFFYIWDADTNTTATISIVNQNTILSGNDFALDDISFATVQVYYDTVWVVVQPQYNSPFDAPSSACTQEAATVTYTGNAPDTADFHWDFGGGDILSGSGPGPYEILFPGVGSPEISLWVDGGGCASDTTYHSLDIGASPDVVVSADNTYIPYGSSTTLHGSYSGGLGPYSYEWSPASLLVDPNSLDPQTTALSITTAFVLAVTDQAAACTGYDTVTVQVTGGPLGVDIVASPSEICEGGQAVLTAEGLGGTGEYSYSWSSDPPGFSSDLATVTVAPAVTTTYYVTVNDGLSIESASISMTVHENPVSNAGTDIIIPYGTTANLQGSAGGGSGNYSYHWEPASLVSNPDSPSTETAELSTSTVFTLYVTDQLTGCEGEPDEVVVQIDGGPLGVVINADPDAICLGDTAVLTALASGGNQGHYTYSWSDDESNNYPGNPQIYVSPDHDMTYHVQVYDEFNSVTATINLTVYPSGEFTWYGGQDVITVCPIDSVVIMPQPHPADWQYLWSNGAVEDHITVGTTGIGFSIQDYTLDITTGHGCTYSRNIQVIFDFANCSGIEENNANPGFLIIPNPGKGRFRIEIDGGGSFNRLSLFNSFSEKVYEIIPEKNQNDITLDLAYLPAGIYFLRLSGKYQAVTKKLIILP